MLTDIFNYSNSVNNKVQRRDGNILKKIDRKQLLKRFLGYRRTPQQRGHV